LDLLYVAEEAFYNLPADWEIGIGEGEHAGIPYFYNAVTGESDWKHPHEEACFRKVKIAKDKKRDMRKSKSKMGNNNNNNSNNNDNNSRNEESNRGMNRRRGDNRDTAGVDRDGAAERRGSSADSRQSVTVDDDDDEVVDIQDFNDEDFAEPSTDPHHQQSNPKREANSSISSGPQQVSKHKSVAFGMSEDDFLDVEPTIGEDKS
jgi:hypothetical protein